MEQQKRCTGCKEQKLLSAFAHDTRYRDGHKSQCKACRAAQMRRRRQEHPEDVQRVKIAWRQKNRQRIRYTARLWRQTHPEQARAIRRRTYLKERGWSERNAWRQFQAELAAIGLRQCSRCIGPQSLHAFYFEKPYGYRSQCKRCQVLRHQLRYQTDPESFRERERERHRSRPDARKAEAKRQEKARLLAGGKKQCSKCTVLQDLNAFYRKRGEGYRPACKACIAKDRDRYRQDDLERSRQQRHRHYLKTREKTLAQNKLWKVKNPDKYKKIHVAASQRRRARQAMAERNDFTPAQWQEMQAMYDYRCVYCPPTCKACKKKTHRLTQDHLTPVVKGGNYTYANILPACKSCNSKKLAGAVLIPVQPVLLMIAK